MYACIYLLIYFLRILSVRSTKNSEYMKYIYVFILFISEISKILIGIQELFLFRYLMTLHQLY